MSIPRNLSKLAEGANSSGVLDVTFGGTNATNAAGARSNLGLGTAATTDSTAYATAAQGATADTAIQTLTSNDGSVVISPTGTTRDLSVGTAASTGKLISQVRNETGATLTKGTVVYVSGASSNKALVSKAQANSDATSAQTYGMVQADIPHNQNGYIVVIGAVGGLNTLAFANGTQLYLSGTNAGEYTSTKPYAPTHLVYVGIVTYQHANQGTIEVKIQNGYEMDELHDVSAQSPANGNTLVYNSTNSLWESTSTLPGSYTFSGGTANGVPYLNGSKVLTSGSALTFNGTTVGINTSIGNSTSLSITGDYTPSNTATFIAVQRLGGAVAGAWSYNDAQGTIQFGTTTNHSLVFLQNNAESIRLTSTGLGIGTTNPSYKLHVAGDAYVSNKFIQGALTSYPQQSISLSVGTATWVKLFSINSPGSCRVRYNGGSQNSEEQGEFSIKGTYVASGTQLSWTRQTYYHSITELRVTGSNSTPYTVWALVRTTDFVHSLNWQVIEALNSVTLHNSIGETPGTAVTTLSYPTYNSTNFSGDASFNGNVGIGTTNPSTNLTIGNGVSGSGLGVYLSRGAVTNFFESYDGTKRFIGGVDPDNAYVKIGSLTNHPVGIVQNNGPAIYIDTGKNVGIGTTNPSVKLNVVGTEYVIVGETLSSTNGDAVRLSLKSPVSQGQVELEWWNDSTRTGGGYGLIQTGKSNNSPDFAVQCGNFGIGTTNPKAKLDVAGGVSISGWSNNNSGSAGGMEIGWDGNQSLIQSYNRVGGVYTPLGFNASKHIFSAGNVGIGRSDPQKLLDIKTSTTTAGTHYLATIGGSSHVSGYAVALGFDPEGYGYRNKIGIIVEGTSAGYSRGKLHIAFNGINNSTEASIADSKVTFLESGNVGIGTTDPQAKLTIKGQTHTAPWLGVERSGSGTLQLRMFNAEDTGYTASSGTVSAPWTNVIDNSNSDFMITTNLGGGTGGRIILDGKVGIGTTTPEGKLEVKTSGDGPIFIGRFHAGAAKLVYAYQSGSDGFLELRTGADVPVTKLSGYAGTTSYFTSPVAVGHTSAAAKLHVGGGSAAIGLESFKPNDGFARSIEICYGQSGSYNTLTIEVNLGSAGGWCYELNTGGTGNGYTAIGGGYVNGPGNFSHNARVSGGNGSLVVSCPVDNTIRFVHTGSTIHPVCTFKITGSLGQGFSTNNISVVYS